MGYIHFAFVLQIKYNLTYQNYNIENAPDRVAEHPIDVTNVCLHFMAVCRIPDEGTLLMRWQLHDIAT